jgi:hypothetical protein
MGTIYRKDTNCCATCAFWAGERQFNSLPSVIVNPSSFGGCTNIRCNACQIKTSKMATEMHCSHYELHPTLR